ncbi:MAG: TonB-dependent receptor plug domain-containing protein [Methylococcaceae bacterium]
MTMSEQEVTAMIAPVTVVLSAISRLCFRIRVQLVIALCSAGVIDNAAYAQQPTEAADKSALESENKEPVALSDVLVTERADSQIGVADSASQGNVGQEQLKYRPISRPGEILETVPGLIASQHSGEGKAKANQYYLRGFNLDHGTDFLTQIDGVPVNMLPPFCYPP